MRSYTLLLISSFGLGAVVADPVTGWLGWPCSDKPVPDSQRVQCVVNPDPNGGDDAPALVKALAECSTRGHVILPGPLYNINSNMNTTGLQDVKIDLYGTILWSPNISYWLSVSMPVGYQNQSTVWFLGGNLIQFNGFDNGTINGNGRAWYSALGGQSNYPHRPMAITIWETTNSVFSGLRFINSQMWTMAVMWSKNVLLQDIYVNSTTTSGSVTSNTDGADTMYADHITFSRWTVYNGDDAISVKANSTNIVITDSVFYKGQGLALGSIGQYPGVYEVIENFYARNISLYGTAYAGYMKTWTGVELGIPPNGGGGGLGYAKNIIWEDFQLQGIRDEPFSITQCNSFSGYGGIDCNTSFFRIEDVLISGVSGTSAGEYFGVFSCSAASGGCTNFTITDTAVTAPNSTTDINKYECTAVVDPVGFTC